MYAALFCFLTLCFHQYECVRMLAFHVHVIKVRMVVSLMSLELSRLLVKHFVAGMEWIEARLAAAICSKHRPADHAPKQITLSAALVRQLCLHAAEQLASALTKLGSLDADPVSLLSAKLYTANVAATCLPIISTALPEHPHGTGSQAQELCNLQGRTAHGPMHKHLTAQPTSTADGAVRTAWHLDMQAASAFAKDL